MQNILHCKCRTVALLMMLLVIGALKMVRAQDVVGVSEILSSTSATEIDTYSATDLSYDVSLYYGAYVEGYLYDNSTLIADGSAQAQQDAYGYMSKPLTVGDIYTIESDHYLVASFAYSDGGTSYYNNPDYFDPGDGGPTDPSGSGFDEGGDPPISRRNIFTSAQPESRFQAPSHLLTASTPIWGAREARGPSPSAETTCSILLRAMLRQALQARE